MKLQYEIDEKSRVNLRLLEKKASILRNTEAEEGTAAEKQQLSMIITNL